jgi:hypothetical protein
MSIQRKLSIAFSVAAIFLLAVGIAAIVFIGQLNPLLGEIGDGHLQMNQVAEAVAALRLRPEQVQQNVARLNDLENWARTDAERQFVREARQAATQDRTMSGAIDKLEQLERFN